MEMYILKSAACLAICFAFYKIFLEGAHMHTLKRFYLLGALMAAILIPFITFTSYVELTPGDVSALSSEGLVSIGSMEVQTAPNYLSMLLWGLYGLGVLFFSIKFGRNLFRLIHKIRNNPHLRDKNIFHVLLNSPVTPHTFFSYIFLNKQKFEAREIPKEVLIHERTHALEKHSLDILFIELLQIVFWFNPMLFFIKNSIKLNHEFLADRAVINHGTETHKYQNMLLAFSSSAASPQLANSINYSSTRLNELFSKTSFGQVKKRFTVMKTHTSKGGIWLRSLLLLPLLAILVYGFSTTEVIEIESTTTSELVQEKEIGITIKNSEVFVNEKSLSLKNFAITLDQITAGWSPKELMNCHMDIVIYKGNAEVFLEKLEYEYRKTQLYTIKKKSLIPPPPPPPPAPDAATAPKVIKGVNDGDPNVPPPPPLPPPAPEFRIKKNSNFLLEGKPISYEKAIKLIEDNNYQVQVLNHDGDTPTVKISTEPFTVKKGSKSNIPPPPPAAPEDPMEYIKKMEDQGATFIYEDKEVTYNYVIDVVLFTKNLNIQTKTSATSPPIVYISREFIHQKGDN